MNTKACAHEENAGSFAFSTEQHANISRRENEENGEIDRQKGVKNGTQIGKFFLGRVEKQKSIER